MPAIQDAAIAIALAEAKNGVFETNNDNRGPRVDQYAIATNGTLGEAWCVKFVYWCYAQAATKLGVPNPLPKIFAAQQLEIWAVRQGKIVKTPMAGDVLIKEHRHGGLVTGPPTGNGTFPSVEGNTWAGTTMANRREGVYVLRNEKVVKCTFIRVA
jgi:hypothetical protein